MKTDFLFNKVLCVRVCVLTAVAAAFQPVACSDSDKLTKMTKKTFLLLLFDFALLSLIGRDLFCSPMMTDSLRNITNYNPLIELKLKSGDNSLHLEERKKGHYKSSDGQKSDDQMAAHESRAKQYLTINEIPDTAHSAYASVVHRGNQVMVNPILAKKVGKLHYTVYGQPDDRFTM